MSERRANPADPTAERTSESATPTASGLSGGRPGPEPARRGDHGDPIPREGEDERATPRRHDDDPERDAVMPTDDSSLGTKI